jgi:hypothetical protein
VVAGGVWGYLPKSQVVSGPTPVTIGLDRGYFDDFQFDLGWDATSSAISGVWELGEPVGTDFGNAFANPEFDATQDNNDQCYVTGNGGGTVGNDDVDNGSVTLTTPGMNLAGYNSATLSFYYWFFNEGGDGSPNDLFQVNALIDGQSVALFSQNNSSSNWRFSGQIALPAAALQSNDVRIAFVAPDLAPGHVVEAGVDIFTVQLSTLTDVDIPESALLLTAAPNPFNGQFMLQYATENTGSMPIIQVRNLLGQTVYTAYVESRSGVLSLGADWTPGVYVLSMYSNSRCEKTLKLVKQ